MMEKKDPNEEVSISMRMPRWLRDEFQVYAATQERNLSSQIRAMMLETLTDWKKRGGAQTDAFSGTKSAQTGRKSK
jgi:hypothetical protein